MIRCKAPVTPWCNNLSLTEKRPVRIKSPITWIQYLREVPGFRSAGHIFSRPSFPLWRGFWEQEFACSTPTNMLKPKIPYLKQIPSVVWNPCLMDDNSGVFAGKKPAQGHNVPPQPLHPQLFVLWTELDESLNGLTFQRNPFAHHLGVSILWCPQWTCCYSQQRQATPNRLCACQALGSTRPSRWIQLHTLQAASRMPMGEGPHCMKAKQQSTLRCIHALKYQLMCYLGLAIFLGVSTSTRQKSIRQNVIKYGISIQQCF